MLQDRNLESLTSRVKKAKELKLQVFFSVKTHKPDFPFRAIISEKGTWQFVISGYLQKQLETLNVVDHFYVSSSDSVVNFLKTQNLGSRSAFSNDVEDMFYSLPHNELMKSVRSCVVDNDEAKFC